MVRIFYSFDLPSSNHVRPLLLLHCSAPKYFLFFLNCFVFAKKQTIKKKIKSYLSSFTFLVLDLKLSFLFASDLPNLFGATH